MSNVIVSTQTNKNIVVTTAGDVINVTVRNGVPLPFPTPGPQGEKGDKGDTGDQGVQGVKGDQGNPTTINGKTGENITLDKNDIGLGSVDNTADADKPISTAMQAALSGKAALGHTHSIEDINGLQTALDAKQGAYSYTPEDAALKQNDLSSPDSSHYPTTNAVATALTTKADLVNGKVPLAQINDALIGNVHYKGLYSFATGVITSDDVTLNAQPLPAAASANAGWYFIAQDSGTADGTSFILGDWLISNGALGWHKVDNTDAVSSVNGYTGNVSLTKSDIGLSNVPNTDATNPANTVQTAGYRFVSDAEKATWNSKQASATTLAGYGITDAVDLTSAQNITGAKSFINGTSSIVIGGNQFDVSISNSMHIQSVSDINLNCYTLYLNGTNGIISNQSISFQNGRGISFVNNYGYTDLLPSASPTSSGYTVRMPNASGIIALQSDIPTGLPPTGTAGGDLSGLFPNPTVAKLNNQLPDYYLNRANHSGLQAWSTISGTPATLAGYGITDAYPLTGNPSGFLTTVPDLSGTYDTLSTNQTITGLKTFSNGIVNTSASAGLTHYNTSDQVTNTEYVQLYWTVNRFFIQSNKAGTGVNRTIYLISNSRSISASPSVSATGSINAEGSINSISGAIFGVTGTFTNTAGNGNGISILPTINQASGTSGYNALYIAPYEQSSLGSGTRYLINAGTQSAANDGGTFTSQFNVTSTGRVGIGTTNSSSRLLISTGVIQSAWTTTGSMFAVTSSNCTDNSTSAGTTVTGPIVLNSFNNGTITASNATSGSNVTYTNAATLYIAGAPTAGTNTAVTNSYALYVNSGNSYFGGTINATQLTAPILTSMGGGSFSSWGTNGIALRVFGSTFNDTSSSGTVSNMFTSAITANTITASSAATYTNAGTLYISGAPTAGANVTITNPYSLYVAAGVAAFAGGLNTGGSFGSNFYAFFGSSATNGIANTFSLFGGASVIATRVALFGTTSTTINANSSYANFLVSSSPITTASSGTHAVLANAVINPVGIVTSGGAAVTNTASLYIGGAATGGTNNWAFYISTGNTFLGSGNVLVGNGTIQGNARLSISAGSAGSNTTTTGVHLAVSSNTYTDNATAASGTATWAVTTSIGGSIFAASNTGVTYTNAATVLIQGPPTAGTNVTITNPYALYVSSGAASFGGTTTISGNLGLNIGSAPSAQFHLGGSYAAAAWGNAGARFRIDGTTTTDTTSSGTVTQAMVHTIGIPNLAASSTTTFTNAATLYIQAAPTAGTNVTITNAYALYIASGNSFFAGGLVSNGTIASNANITASAGITSNRAAIAATSTDGFIVQNNTAATSGTQVQYSPRIKFSGQAWNTTSLASQNVTFLQEVQPAAGNPVTANLVFSSQVNAGTVTAVTTLSDTGTLTTVQHGWKSLSTDPTTSNIAAGTYQVYKNTASGAVKLWVNDGGTLKSVTLT